ncbi:hypothetical protein G8A07_21775 [Roseateles sp. DAIF2]|uniref:PEP-CTERM sorting domain-containing protein n=1 Tax=Roseateles sp. DAIF2 TaxID=2714952 RepID=UPI0018A2E410|nr:PEP-CTERM sorting domain-containing protein [Roseateles sp. DAIF2]QPF75288.1 hypothetical protein G8A07_21775 [Roseateles sp. DAIF2]
MSVFSLRPTVAALVLGFSSLSPAIAAPVALDVGVWGSNGPSGLTRGYWFTAPTDFLITGIYLPGRAAAGDGSTLELLRFNSDVTDYPTTTNNFSSLGFWANVGSVSTSIQVSAGDIIGVLGYSGGDNSTPYRNQGGNYSTQLGGFNIDLVRLGFQGLGQAQNVWQEEGGTTGVIGLNYELLNTVPEPAGLALALSALALMGFVRRRPTV